MSESTDLHQRALELFDELVELPDPARAQPLARLQASDPALHAEVIALLAADAHADGVLERDARALFADTEDATDAQLGRLVGPWQITGTIGRGGMGTVYRGERSEGGFQQVAAIKLIRVGMDRPDLRRRFLRERQLLARLQHRNIATLLDGGVADNDAPYFAMELVEGMPIDCWCDTQQLDLHARIRLFLQVCDAVQHAHQNLAVHRDLKPSNILVTAAGQAKLLDFGIAKLLEDEAGDTQTRDRPLTPEYAAPEQLHGDVITTAADLYALGVVLYGLLAGAHPFARSTGSAMERHLARLEGEAEPITRAAARLDPAHARLRRLTPRALAGALRGDLSAIVHRCLQPEPARRYASADALARDLKAWLDGLPVHARIGHRGYRLRKFVMRHRWGVAASVAALIAIGGALGVALVQARAARQQAQLAQQSAARAEVSAAHALTTRNFAVSLFATTNPFDNAQGAQATAADLLRAAAKRVDAELADAPRSQAELRAAIGEGLHQLGDRERGRDLLDRSISQMHALGIAGVPLVEALQARAVAQRETGDEDGAERDIREALDVLAKVPGDERSRQIKLRGSLASVIAQRGNLREALTLHQANLADRKALLGDGHEDIAVNWNNVAAAHLRLDQFAQAEAAFQHADDILVKRRGADFPRRAWTLGGIASARLHLADRIALTEAALTAAEQVMRKSLGAKHPIGATLLSHRASLHARQGQHALAEVLYAEALTRARTAAADTADTIEAFLGISQLAQGRAEGARPHLQAAVTAMRSQRTASEPQLNRAQSALGLARFQLGERAAGEHEIRAVLARLQTAGFAATDDYAETAADLATALEASGRVEEARGWRQRSHATFVKVYGAAHPRTLLAVPR